jgi:hypothetical protein
MTSWIRVALIIVVVTIDDILREIYWSFKASQEFFLDRVRWIVLEKLRYMWRGPQR